MKIKTAEGVHYELRFMHIPPYSTICTFRTGEGKTYRGVAVAPGKKSMLRLNRKKKALAHALEQGKVPRAVRTRIWQDLFTAMAIVSGRQWYL